MEMEILGIYTGQNGIMVELKDDDGFNLNLTSKEAIEKINRAFGIEPACPVCGRRDDNHLMDKRHKAAQNA